MDLGVIGNCKSAALIDKKGTIVWCCLPDFDSPSVFASLLDEKRGGFFGIQVDDSYSITQDYIPNTNILHTVFESPQGGFELIDLMPRHKENGHYYAPPELLRYFRPTHGNPVCSIQYCPRLGYGRHETQSYSKDKYIKSKSQNGAYESLYLYTSLKHADVLQGTPFALKDDAFLLLSYDQKIRPVTLDRIVLEVERTKVYWLDWVERTTPFSRWSKEIRRSALVLKLLSYQDTGAIMAAITTSLPETLGEGRNWDYRFCWIRDATMMLNILTKIGHFNVAQNFFSYVLRVVPYKDDEIQVMYGIRGNKNLTEKTLDWLEGYKGSQPVRVGNAAYSQRQHDIYGVLLNAILHYMEAYRIEEVTLEKLWTITRSLVRNVIRMWRQPDVSIWEYRANPGHFTFSKMLCWVAMDRGIKIAQLLAEESEVESWVTERDLIRVDILTHGWSESVGAFTQRYGSDNLDASMLLMASYDFIEPDDPKFVSTVKKIQQDLSRDGLMFRYKNDDDFGTPTSSFTVCSFWMVKALWQIGEHQEAEHLFEKLLSYATPLGLFSEDLDFKTKDQLGNFPQGYSHLAVIDCAILLGDMKPPLLPLHNRG